jgi:exodeoxyribonuclease VII large subunit
MAEIKPETKVYSVDEITTYLKILVEHDKILQNLWIKGEISNFRNSDKGHMYFSLKDENCIIDCAMFQRANQSLQFSPKDGMKVLIRGNVEIYGKRGIYQIVIEEMHIAGKGELYLKYLQLKEKLEKEGLFRREHKRRIPKYPKTIGVVTSPEGSVVHDIIKVIKRRYPHVRLIIFPSQVQGDNAKYQIVRGIKGLNLIRVDVIIVARGGGSFEDLWPFNEEMVARAVYDSEIPIISAIGHETDFTIIDFVADIRAATPSVAAELAVPNEIDIQNCLNNSEDNLCQHLINTLDTYKQRIQHILSAPSFKRCFSLIDTERQFLDDKENELTELMIKKIEILKIELKGMNGKLCALSPNSILKRGYSLTMKNGKLVLSIKNLKLNDTITTIVNDGEISSKINKKNERKNI